VPGFLDCSAAATVHNTLNTLQHVNKKKLSYKLIHEFTPGCSGSEQLEHCLEPWLNVSAELKFNTVEQQLLFNG
jgi:hypothetical protein